MSDTPRDPATPPPPTPQQGAGATPPPPSPYGSTPAVPPPPAQPSAPAATPAPAAPPAQPAPSAPAASAPSAPYGSQQQYGAPQAPQQYSAPQAPQQYSAPQAPQQYGAPQAPQPGYGQQPGGYGQQPGYGQPPAPSGASTWGQQQQTVPYAPAQGAAPARKGGAGLAVIALLVGVVGIVVGAIMAVIGGLQLGTVVDVGGLFGALGNEAERAVLSPVKGSAYLAEIGVYIAAGLGLVGIVLSIVALVKKAPRGLALAALIVSILSAPIVFGILLIAVAIG